MSKFQVILLVIFGLFIVVAVGTFALYRGSSSSEVTITVWGDIHSNEFQLLLADQTIVGSDGAIQYVEKSANTIESEFTEALARGEGPDLIILSEDKYWSNRAKLMPIPYASIGERDFKTTFVEEGELFLDPAGIYALPLTIDPLVLYYNRDLLSAAGIAKPLEYWDEIYTAASNLSKRDAAGNIISSVMALGEARNIPHSKDILALLLLQAGTPITTSDASGKLVSQLGNNFGLAVSPAESALNFYTQFSNPTKTFYSWNRSLLDAQTNFASGDSAYYIGFASERMELRSKNPTLNFGVSLVPQSRVSGRLTTLGRLRGIAISRNTKYPQQALTAATKLVSQDASRLLSQTLGLPPARRDLLSSRPTDAVYSVYFDAALQSRSWLDPDSSATRAIFTDAIESVTSGRARVSEALTKANRDINELAN